MSTTAEVQTVVYEHQPQIRKDVIKPAANASQAIEAIANPAPRAGSATADGVAGYYQQKDANATASPFSSSPSEETTKTPEGSRSRGDEEDEDEVFEETPKNSLRGPPSRMVSWQDDITGQELVTVREFEPSEIGTEIDDTSWEVDKKTCCSIM